MFRQFSNSSIHERNLRLAAMPKSFNIDEMKGNGENRESH